MTPPKSKGKAADSKKVDKTETKKKNVIHHSRKKGHVPGTDSWEVEDIVDYRFSPGPSSGDVDGAKQTLYFAVKWCGYGEEDISLEPVTYLVQSMHLVKQFLKKRGKVMIVSADRQEAFIVDECKAK